MSTMIQSSTGQGAVQVAVRLSPSLRDELKEIAGQRGQSLNTLIVMTMAKETDQSQKK